MGNWGYFVLSSYILPLGMGVALLMQKRLSFVGLILWLYLLLTVFVEVGGAVLAFNGINNLWLYRVYMYAELIFPGLVFLNQFSKRRGKILVLIISLSAIVLTTITNLFDDWQSYASIQTVITFGCAASIIISYFVEMFQLEKVFNPFKDVYFIIGATLLLGQSCTLIYFVLYNYLASGYFGSDILSVLSGVNMSLVLFYNVLYSYALWVSRHRPT